MPCLAICSTARLATVLRLRRPPVPLLFFSTTAVFAALPIHIFLPVLVVARKKLAPFSHTVYRGFALLVRLARLLVRKSSFLSGIPADFQALPVQRAVAIVCRINRLIDRLSGSRLQGVVLAGGK